jgi:hypothetical protein
MANIKHKSNIYQLDRYEYEKIRFRLQSLPLPGPAQIIYKTTLITEFSFYGKLKKFFFSTIFDSKKLFLSGFNNPPQERIISSYK